MTDAVHPERLDRAPDARRARRLAGMGAGPEPRLAGGLIDRREGLRRIKVFRPADADAENAGLVRNLDDLGQRDGRSLRPVVADEIGNQVEGHLRHTLETAADGGRQPGRLEPVLRKPARREEQLGIADVLARQVRRHGLGDEG